MDLSSLLSDLHLPPSPPITDLLSSLSLLIGSCPDSSLFTVVSKLEHFFQTSDPEWLLSSNWSSVGDLGAGPEQAYLSVCRALIGRAALPLGDDDVWSPSDSEYLGIGARAEAVSRALTTLLRILGKNREEGGASERVLLTVAPDICVFAVTHFQVQAWSSPSSRSAAQEVMRTLLETGPWTDSTHLLLGDRKPEVEGQEVEKQRGRAKGILGGVLDVLQPQLTKDSMFGCEAVKLVFSWTLLQVSRPALSSHLSRLMPPSLLLTDHYRPENCILGVRCLHHIVLHTASAELRQWNRAEVLYQALFRLLYSNQAAVLQSVLSCLMDLLLVLEKPHSSLGPSPSSTGTPCRHDDVLRLVLTQMEAEHKVSLRRVYASALPPFFDRLGVAVCRHLKRLQRVILGYLELSDPPDETCRIQTLETLQRTLKIAWPRVQHDRVQVFLRALLKLLLDVSSDSSLKDSVKQQLFDQSAASLRLLDTCSNGTLQCLLLQVNSSHCSPDLLQVFHSAAANTAT